MTTLDYWFKHTVLNLPVLASEHGKSVDDLIVYVHILMVVLFVGWFGYFLYALVRFRQLGVDLRQQLVLAAQVVG